MQTQISQSDQSLHCLPEYTGQIRHYFSWWSLYYYVYIKVQKYKAIKNGSRCLSGQNTNMYQHPDGYHNMFDT